MSTTTSVHALRTGLRCEAVAVVAADKQTKTDGRWRLYSGAPIMQVLPVDKMYRLVLVVVDLATVKFSKPEIPANYAHWEDAITGRWTNGTINPTTGIEADLTLYRDDDEACPDAARIAALLDRDHPWEASIEEDPRTPADYERVMPGQTVQINGRSVTADDETPLLIARNLSIHACAIVPHGADMQTGRIAAALSAHLTTTTPPPPPAGAPMSNLKALLARHPASHHALIAGLVADGKPEVEIDQAVQAQVVKAKDDEIAALKAQIQAKDAEIVQLKAGNPPPPTGTTDGGTAVQPKTLAEASAILRAEGIKGAANIRERKRRWPSLA